MSYDLVVVGGGIAGIAAAVQAARQGCRVALVEKTALTGGLATAGLINVFRFATATGIRSVSALPKRCCAGV